MTQIFEHIRVIDLTQGMAGPVATMILADYGAEVIRLEPPGGDPMWNRPAYMVWNRGKKSVELDWFSVINIKTATGISRHGSSLPHCGISKPTGIAKRCQTAAK